MHVIVFQNKQYKMKSVSFNQTEKNMYSTVRVHVAFICKEHIDLKITTFGL